MPLTNQFQTGARMCECDECAKRIGISRACLRNSLLISVPAWLVLGGIAWCVLKIFN